MRITLLISTLAVSMVSLAYAGSYQLTNVTISPTLPPNLSGVGDNEAMFETVYTANWLGTQIGVRDAAIATSRSQESASIDPPAHAWAPVLTLYFTWVDANQSPPPGARFEVLFNGNGTAETSGDITSGGIWWIPESAFAATQATSSASASASGGANCPGATLLGIGGTASYAKGSFSTTGSMSFAPSGISVGLGVSFGPASQGNYYFARAAGYVFTWNSGCRTIPPGAHQIVIQMHKLVQADVRAHAQGGFYNWFPATARTIAEAKAALVGQMNYIQNTPTCQ